MEKKVYIRPCMMTVRMRSNTLMAASVTQSTVVTPQNVVDDGVTELGSREMGNSNSNVWDD